MLTHTLPINLAPPTSCPSCNTELVMDGAFPLCPNFHCKMRVYGRLQKFVDVLDIKGSGIETLKQLVDANIVKTPADLFNVTEVQFCELERKGSKHYEKFIQGLEAIKEMSLAQFFASLDIAGIGTWEAICTVPGLQSIDAIVHNAKLSPARMRTTRVSVEIAEQIGKEIANIEPDIRALQAKVTIKKAGSKMLGKVICITGTLSRPRPAIEKCVKDLGGKVCSSVTGETTHLVCNEKSNSTKYQAALRKGIPVITEEQLNAMMLL